jgi:phosphoribosyl-dephospho-CoA transferase
MPNLDAFKPYAALPCFRALHQFSYAAAGHQLTWGPVGSVGFELATGLHVTTSTSDLDIMIRIAAQADFTYLSKLHRETSRMSTFVDVLLENAHGAVSLSEYLSSPHQLLIRTEDGPRLGIFLV